MKSAGSRIQKSIYGISARKNAQAPCTQDYCGTLPTLTDFYTLLESVRRVVDELFPAARAQAPYVARMAARGMVPVPIFVRLLWRTRHKGVVFTASQVQLIQLRDMYLECGFDPTTDRIFDALPHPLV